MCLEKLATTVGKFDTRELTFGWIRNTMELGTLRLSENLRAEIEANPALEIIGDAEPFAFDSEGNLAGIQCQAKETVSKI